MVGGVTSAVTWLPRSFPVHVKNWMAAGSFSDVTEQSAPAGMLAISIAAVEMRAELPAITTLLRVHDQTTV